MRIWTRMMVLAAALAAAPVSAAPAFITLGTMGGPIADPHRSQPANLIVDGSDAWLVDCGDGTVEQLAKAGIRLPQVKALFLSHLHFDHTGGVAALLGLRYQTNVPGRLAIYGPPGTRAMVDGLLASMAPAAAAGYGLPGEPQADPAAMVEVTEIASGSVVRIGAATVTAAQNSHYSFAPGSDADRRFKSLAFRFDLPGRSIAYTGDTGPSAAVAALARGVDLLVSELIDVDATVANVRRNTPDMPAPAIAALTRHLSGHHLTAAQVGELAVRAGAKQLVVTHLVAPGATPAALDAIEAQIAAAYKGSIVIAQDLQRF
jgi:ribonuclease BN (tRNA processing enzyme)